jgi:phage baseplate assembly protein W
MAYRIPNKNIIDVESKGLSKIGISIPFNNSNIFNATYTTKEQIKSNLINLVLTQKGEKIFEPNFGTDIRKILFELEVSNEIIFEEISNIANLYIPEINIEDISVINNEHFLTLNIYYKLNITQETDNISINL